ncbi:MAG: UDP-glucose--hexose-1-phosphate uridylyltransferase [Chloroflexi bacterium]|nr:UDP-glucose--hexose-1-phosphate uridylyltransferase [Chloroflexota bacterium]
MSEPGSETNTAELFASPHRRYNPLTREWILVSPHRTQRPWLGHVDAPPADTRPAYDPDCYLCPGNTRAGGNPNPAYDSTFVFDNDFAALTPDASANELDPHGILRATSERGICRVICFSPRHDLTLAQMTQPDIRRVVDVWIAQTLDLGAREFIRYVQVFENKGAQMGASNPHPHCQVWATEHIPTEPAKELASLAAYRDEKHACLLCDYLVHELAQRERIVVENAHFVALVPFWAVWPFETMVLARRHRGALPNLNDDERDALADILRRLTAAYDRVFDVSFPYSMGWHVAPVNDASSAAHLHAHFYPPLLRSATVRKFMVGYEMLGEPQRDMIAESAAVHLRVLMQ